LSHQASVMSGGKKKNVKEQIVISMTEMHELIAFLDYSFERAFKVKENGYIGAYQVSSLFMLIICLATHLRSFETTQRVRTSFITGRIAKEKNRKAKRILIAPGFNKNVGSFLR
jgi:hypothetical protein